MRIAVTGAAGFLGQPLVRALHRRGDEIVAIDRAPNPGLDVREWVRAPLQESQTVAAHLVGVDCVVHLAWHGIPGDAIRSAGNDLTNNVAPTLALYLAAANAGAERFVFPSSGGTVYGNTPKLPISEETPLHPVSVYGAGKAAAERYLGAAEANGGPSLAVLRIANAYGPGQIPGRGQGFVATAIATALADRELTIWGDGSAVRDYIFIDDIVSAILALIGARQPSGIFNVGTGIGLSLRECVATIADVLERQFPLTYVAPRGVDVKQNVLDSSCLTKQTGWVPRVDFRSGIEATVKWIADHRDRWP